MNEDGCDCNIPVLEGAGQHSPGCSIFKQEDEMGTEKTVQVEHPGHEGQKVKVIGHELPDASVGVRVKGGGGSGNEPTKVVTVTHRGREK